MDLDKAEFVAAAQEEQPLQPDFSNYILPDQTTCNATEDGPRYQRSERLDGTVVERQAAPLGSGQHIFELIEQRRFQNDDASLTEAGRAAICAYLHGTNFAERYLQTYESRAAQLQTFLNQRTDMHMAVEFTRAKETNQLTAPPHEVRIAVAGFVVDRFTIGR